MTGRLVGTVALVTGASSGIGVATAIALAAEGATVAIAARRRDRLEAVAGQIGDPGRVLILETDVTDEEQARTTVERTVAECGRLDTLVNNAGVTLLGPIAAGRVARRGSGVYNATKFGVVAFSESLRQEVTTRHVRVSVIEPGAVMTELATHNRPEIIEGMAATVGGVEMLRAVDIAEAITFTITRSRHAAVNEMVVRPTEQER